MREESLHCAHYGDWAVGHAPPAAKGYASRNVVSAGLGFNLTPATSIDLAWSRMLSTTDSFQLYDDYSSAVTVPTGTNTNSLNKVVCTLAVKF